MLTAYIAAAMRRAEYKELPGGEGWYGEIPGLDGVWGNAESREAVERDLRDALEGWLVLGLQLGHPIPAIEGIALDFTPATA
jgi:predicted RNase H-like HicB family nuclease